MTSTLQTISDVKWQWPQLLKAYFGKEIEPHEFARWLQELRDLFGPDILDSEICDSIRNRSNSDKEEKWVNLSDLVRWVKLWVGEPNKVARVAPNESYDEYNDRLIARAFRNIDDATEAHEVWGAIMSVGSLDPKCGSRAKIDAYAKRTRPTLYHFYDGKSYDEVLVCAEIGGNKKDWIDTKPPSQTA